MPVRLLGQEFPAVPSPFDAFSPAALQLELQLCLGIAYRCGKATETRTKLLPATSDGQWQVEPV